ncbi:MAG: glycosyl hydrolase [Opitutus sp.]
MISRSSFRPLAQILCALGALICVKSHGATLLGVYYGDQGWKMADVRALESWQGKKNAVVVLFTDWSSTTKVMNNLFSQQLPNIWNNGNVPLVTWEPFTGGNTPVDVEVRIAAGQYDAYIKTWAGRMKLFLSGPDGKFGTADDRRAYIRLGHEMNGNWYPWSAATGGNSPASYVAMWRRVVGMFDELSLGAEHLQWIWCVNNDDVGGSPAESFYPGDGYVDWVAIDGYNWGRSQTWSTWLSPAQLYDGMLARIRAITTKPVALTEFASTTSGGSVALKSQWITDLFGFAASRNIQLVAWFNEDKETDWALFGGAAGDGQFKVGRTTYRTYEAYRSAVASPNIIVAQPSSARLLTDAEFSGQ